MARVTIAELKAMKSRGDKIAMLTAYDYPTAHILDEVGVPIILVGDSLGMVVLGYDSTLPVTMEDMIHHARAVVRGTQRAHIVFDMPFMSYQSGVEDALRNAGRALKETGAQSVKLEGGAHMAETVRRLVEVGIPVMGHIGLTPQSVNQLGGFRVQGKTPAAAVRLLNDARALEQAGAYAIVLETIPAPLARIITSKVSVPTIGIGAGPHCDGQVQVIYDLLGLYPDFVPKHCRQYANLADEISRAVGRYMDDVGGGAFPGPKESFTMDESVLAELAQGSEEVLRDESPSLR
jgi:3-methyl-2-oxobutanoate hydroxymethyltransferase